jgi:hypothetical protein
VKTGKSVWKMATQRNKSIVLAKLGSAAKIPPCDLLVFESGHLPARNREDCRLRDRVARAREIRVRSVKLNDIPRSIHHNPIGVSKAHTYRVTLTCVRELNLPYLQRLITLGVRAAEEEDAGE